MSNVGTSGIAGSAPLPTKRMQQKHPQVKSAHFATAGSQVKGDSRGALLRDHGSKEAQEMQSNSMRSKPSVSPNFTKGTRAHLLLVMAIFRQESNGLLPVLQHPSQGYYHS